MFHIFLKVASCQKCIFPPFWKKNKRYQKQAKTNPSQRDLSQKMTQISVLSLAYEVILSRIVELPALKLMKILTKDEEAGYPESLGA